MNFKSKIEQTIYDNLLNIFPEPIYEVRYERNILIGTKYTLNIDFTVYCNNVELVHVEYSGMNFFKKYLKLIDVCKQYNVFVIFDTDKMVHEISVLQSIPPTKCSEYSNKKIFDRINKFNDEVSELK